MQTYNAKSLGTETQTHCGEPGKEWWMFISVFFDGNTKEGETMEWRTLSLTELYLLFWVCYLFTFLMCRNQLIVDDDSDHEKKGEV